MTPMVRIAALTNYLEEARYLINEVHLERVLRYMENLRYSLSRIACLAMGCPVRTVITS